MISARYLVAKYVPDMWRMEPRNIGVIVWTPDGVGARFIAERNDKPGSIDGRSVPGYVNSASAYKQWVDYWRSSIDQPAFSPLTGGSPVSKSSPEFVEALKSTGRGNYMLAEGGALLDTVEASDVQQLVEQLYWMLVDGRSVGIEEPHDPTLDEVCEDVIRTVRLDQHPKFHKAHSLDCRVGDATETYTFSYAFGGTRLQRLYQRVALSKQPATLRKTIHDCGWIFRNVVEHNLVERDQCVSLVYATDAQYADPAIHNALAVLGQVTRVVNVVDHSKIVREFTELADLKN